MVIRGMRLQMKRGKNDHEEREKKKDVEKKKDDMMKKKDSKKMQTAGKRLYGGNDVDVIWFVD